MTQPDQIRWISRGLLDTRKWDACIDRAPNGLIYAYSFYLDHMATNWDGLVLNDYQAVMPLTWRNKYGIYYLYQPAFVPNMGMFGAPLTAILLTAFIRAIPVRFKWVGIPLNHSNELQLQARQSRMNYILPLSRDYDLLQGEYREHIRRNIKKARLAGLVVKEGIALGPILALSKTVMEYRSKIKNSDYTRFERLFKFLEERGQAKTFGVYSPQQELLASCVFFFSHARAYYILVGNHPKGKTTGASHLLIDDFIWHHARQDVILDFEGSDIAGLAFFYQSFGAHQESYPFLEINRLPWWIRWLKK